MPVAMIAKPSLWSRDTETVAAVRMALMISDIDNRDIRHHGSLEANGNTLFQNQKGRNLSGRDGQLKAVI